MTSAATRRPSAEEGRARLIKLIHVARGELERAGQLDEPGYRAILRAASGDRHDSSADMSYTALKAALERLKRAGFQVRKSAGSRPLATAPVALKARALWLFLHALGAVKDPGERALSAYARRIAKVDDLRWMRGVRADLPSHPGRAELVIETLKKWAMRHLPEAVARLQNEVVEAHRAGGLTPERAEHAAKAWHALKRGTGFDVHWEAWGCLMKALDRPVAADLAPLDTGRRPGC